MTQRRTLASLPISRSEMMELVGVLGNAKTEMTLNRRNRRLFMLKVLVRIQRDKDSLGDSFVIHDDGVLRRLVV